MSLKTETISGIKWVLVTSVSQRLLGIATTICLARLLNPADFGLFALAFVLIDGLGLFKSLGVDSALIRQKDRVEEAADTAFCLMPLMGLFLSTFLFFAAPFGAALLKNSALTPVVRALSVIFVFACLEQTPAMLLQKRMLFWKKGLAEFIATVSYSAVALVLAFSGFGVWSLVYAYLSKTAVNMGMVWAFAGWRPRFRFRKDLALQMLHYGKYIFGGSFLIFLRNNLDNVIVGRVLGVSAVGFYFIAFGIANFPAEYIIGKMSGVLFPAFSKIQDDDGALCRGFLKSLKLISLIAIPFGLTLTCFSPLFLKVVYGEKWLPAAEVLRLLAMGGMLRALSGSQSPVFLAKGKSRLDFVVSVIHVGLFFILIVPFTRAFGLNGAGSVVLLSGAASFLIGMARVRRVLPIHWREMVNSLKPALIGSGIMLFIFRLLTVTPFSLGHLAAPVSTLGVILMAGISGIAYLFSIFLLDRDVRLEVRRLV